MVRAALETERGKSSSSSSSSGGPRRPPWRDQGATRTVGGRRDLRSGPSSSLRRGPRLSSEAASWSITTTASRRPFPETLFLLVNECTASEPHVVRWVPDGTAFEVRDAYLLPSVLSRYFRHDKYSSLARMLYLYGFRKCNSGGGPIEGTFQHPHFARTSTRESLVALVTRVGVSAAAPTAAAFLADYGSLDMSARTPSSSMSTRGKKPTPASSSRPAEDSRHPPRSGAIGSDVVPGHSSSSTKANGSDGASHPRFLFDLPTNDVSSKVGSAPPDDADLAPPGRRPNWNLSSYTTVSGVRYFKSDIGKMWVEQVVPRMTLKPGGPPSDKYFLNPGGLRFRSMLEVNRFLDSCDSKPKEELDDEVLSTDSHNEEFASSVASEFDEEGSMPGGDEEGPLNPCMCKKSKCLKLYCECFNKGRYCTADCYCVECRNKPRHDAERDRAIEDILMRNPDAFKPRVKTTIECRCKRSACLKKYCDCFSHGVYCSDTCRCKGCENVDPEKVVVRKRPKQESGRDQIARAVPSVQPSCMDAMDASNNRPDFHREISSVTALDSSPRKRSSNAKSEWHEPIKKEVAPKNNLNNAGGTMPVNAGRPAAVTTLHCPKCSKVFHYSFAKTAGASLSRHVKYCKGGGLEMAVETNTAVKQANEARATTSGKVRRRKPHHALLLPSRAGTNDAARQQKSTATTGPPVTLHCPHCSKDFTYGIAKIAAASFANHVRSCSLKMG